MKKLATILFILIPSMISYLFFTFALWDFNPANWGEGVRLSCATFALIATVPFAAATMPT